MTNAMGMSHESRFKLIFSFVLVYISYTGRQLSINATKWVRVVRPSDRTSVAQGVLRWVRAQCCCPAVPKTTAGLEPGGTAPLGLRMLVKAHLDRLTAEQGHT